ncbi:MAG: hypothetical protein J1F64_06345 [Oscillospiraceae bacterium]|nr:hypothetical protein [Oscillospiraceae bacterium]
MINNVNKVNTEYLNTVQTAETASTMQDDKASGKELEKSVYERANIKDSLDLSASDKGLGASEIRSMQDAIQQNKMNALLNMVNSTNSIYQQRGISGGISLEDSVSLITAYNKSKYAKQAFEMYFNKQKEDTSDIDSLKSQITELEDEIAKMENGEKQ